MGIVSNNVRMVYAIQAINGINEPNVCQVTIPHTIPHLYQTVDTLQVGSLNSDVLSVCLSRN